MLRKLSPVVASGTEFYTSAGTVRVDWDTYARITAREAQHIQAEAYCGAYLLMWSVLKHPAGMEDFYVAVPAKLNPRKLWPIGFYLATYDLRVLRKQLPSGLSVAERFDADEAEVLEVWISSGARR